MAGMWGVLTSNSLHSASTNVALWAIQLFFNVSLRSNAKARRRFVHGDFPSRKETSTCVLLLLSRVWFAGQAFWHRGQEHQECARENTQDKSNTRRARSAGHVFNKYVGPTNIPRRHQIQK